MVAVTGRHVRFENEPVVEEIIKVDVQVDDKPEAPGGSILYGAFDPRSEQTPGYLNITPWSARLLFVHSYYAYIYTFMLLMLSFYKGYALEFPSGLREVEIILILLLSPVHHLTFFFGQWGCELGTAWDLVAFLLLCSATLALLSYFMFYQAYIFRLDTGMLWCAVGFALAEGMCGCTAALQLLSLSSLSSSQLVLLPVCVFFFMLMVAATVTQAFFVL